MLCWHAISAISSSLLELFLTCALPPVLSWLCQKNRVEQQLHEHLQDAMSFLKDVCEVLFLLDGAFFVFQLIILPIIHLKPSSLYRLQSLLKSNNDQFRFCTVCKNRLLFFMLLRMILFKRALLACAFGFF